MTYVAELKQVITEIEQALKLRKTDAYVPLDYGGSVYNVSDRSQRIILVDAVTSDYAREHAEYNQRVLDRWRADGCKGERPATVLTDSALLSRLADAITDEELRDSHPDKITREEYPFMSEHQLDRRRSDELPLKIAEEIGTDGRNYRLQLRRKRTRHENKFVDAHAKIRNKKRATQYRIDTSAGEVVRYTLAEGLRARWTKADGILRTHAVTDVCRRVLPGVERVR